MLGCLTINIAPFCPYRIFWRFQMTFKNMNKIKTDATLKKQLKKAASHSMSKKEIHNQRISFVYGNLSSRNNSTIEDVKQFVKKYNG